MQWHLWTLPISTRQELDKQERIAPGHKGAGWGPISRDPCQLRTGSFHHHQLYHQALLGVSQSLPEKHRIWKQTNACDIYLNPPLYRQGHRKGDCRPELECRIPIPSHALIWSILLVTLFQLIHWLKNAIQFF